MTCTVLIDEASCLAHGDCAEIAPDVFRVDETAVVIGAAPLEELRAVAEACPAAAISIVDDATGARLYP
jgi:ferredoxin